MKNYVSMLLKKTFSKTSSCHYCGGERVINSVGHQCPACNPLEVKQKGNIMEITKMNVYLDGGTISMQTNCGSFCLDRRMVTGTNKLLNCGYPSGGQIELVDDSTKQKIRKALKSYALNASEDDGFLANEVLRYIGHE